MPPKRKQLSPNDSDVDDTLDLTIESNTKKAKVSDVSNSPQNDDNSHDMVLISHSNHHEGDNLSPNLKEGGEISKPVVVSSPSNLSVIDELNDKTIAIDLNTSLHSESIESSPGNEIHTENDISEVIPIKTPAKRGKKLGPKNVSTVAKGTSRSTPRTTQNDPKSTPKNKRTQKIQKNRKNNSDSFSESSSTSSSSSSDDNNDDDSDSDQFQPHDIKSMTLADLYDTFNPHSRASRSKSAAISSTPLTEEYTKIDKNDTQKSPKKHKNQKLTQKTNPKTNPLLPSGQNSKGLDSDEEVDQFVLPDCCLDHSCINTPKYQNSFSQDIQQRFLLESSLSSAFTARYHRLEPYGTISNDIVKLCVSDLAATPMLGLFAKRDIPSGYPVTSYGGIGRLQQEISDEPRAHFTHARSIPGSGSCSDGKPLADLIKQRQNSTLELRYGMQKKPVLYRDLVGEYFRQVECWERENGGGSDPKNGNNSENNQKNKKQTLLSQEFDSLINQTPMLSCNPELIYNTHNFSPLVVRQAAKQKEKEKLEWTTDFDNFSNIYKCKCSQASRNRCLSGQCICVYKRLLLEYVLDWIGEVDAESCGEERDEKKEIQIDEKVQNAQLSAQNIPTPSTDPSQNNTPLVNSPISISITDTCPNDNNNASETEETEETFFDRKNVLLLKQFAKQLRQLPVCNWHEYHLPIDKRTEIIPMFVEGPVGVIYPTILNEKMEEKICEKFLKIYPIILDKNEKIDQKDVDIVQIEQDTGNDMGDIGYGVNITDDVNLIEHNKMDSTKISNVEDKNEKNLNPNNDKNLPEKSALGLEFSSNNDSPCELSNNASYNLEETNTAVLPTSFYTFFNKLHLSGVLSLWFFPPFIQHKKSKQIINCNSNIDFLKNLFFSNQKNSNNSNNSNPIIAQKNTPQPTQTSPQPHPLIPTLIQYQPKEVVSFQGITLDPLDFQIRLRNSGIGFMSNTSEKNRHNIKIDPVDILKSSAALPLLLLKATRDINKDEEIISPYNNVDDRYVKRFKKKV